MTVIDVSSAPHEWAYAAPRRYSPAVRAQFASVGAQWDGDQRGYRVPLEALAIVRERLTDARAAVFVESENLLPTPSLRAATDRVRHAPNTDLFAYQRDGVEFLCDRLQATGAALLADDPGLGKSAQALRALAALGCERLTIVCPAVVQRHWVEQHKRWGGPATISVTSYDKLRSSHARGGSPLSADAVILDELHYVSNRRSQRSTAARKLLDQPRRPLVIGLTGTPIPTRVRDLYNPLDTLWPGRFGSWTRFTERYCGGHEETIEGVGTVWQADGSGNVDELRRRLGALMLRRERTNPAVQADIPPLQRIVLPVELPAAVRTRLSTVAAQVIDADSIGRLLGAIEEHKIDAAVELVESLRNDGRRPLVFATRRATAAKLGQRLVCPVVDGSVDAKDRVAMVANVPLAVATLWSLTTGVDLTHFDTIVFVGLDWVPATLLQAIARVQRIGQRSDVIAYCLVGLGTADEIVRERVIERLDVTSAVVGASSEGAALAEALGGEEDLLMGIIAAVRECVR